MNILSKVLPASFVLTVLASCTVTLAATLAVGPGKQFGKPSQAIAAAKAGDTIEIDASGIYAGDVATIRQNRLKLRGVGRGRARLPAAGHNAGGKAIWVIAGGDCFVENIEFSGARVPDKNGAGIRPEGANLTVNNCRFVDCENGILGGVGELRVEHCEFDRCGPVAQPATHSIYVGERVTKLIFQFNYSHNVIQGHLLKSRAQSSWLLYNRLSDDDGTSSAVADFPNGGYVVVLGNILHKGRKAQNDRMIAYGMEGIKHTKNALFVVSNTMIDEFRRPSYFVRADNVAANFAPVIRNNLCVGAMPLTNCAHALADGNLIFKTSVEAGLKDIRHGAYTLTAQSPAIGQGVPSGRTGDFELVPKFEYVQPALSEPRENKAKLDVGAFAAPIVSR